jgi:hypothetical protein
MVWLAMTNTIARFFFHGWLYQVPGRWMPDLDGTRDSGVWEQCGSVA